MGIRSRRRHTRQRYRWSQTQTYSMPTVIRNHAPTASVKGRSTPNRGNRKPRNMRGDDQYQLIAFSRPADTAPAIPSLPARRAQYFISVRRYSQFKVSPRRAKGLRPKNVANQKQHIGRTLGQAPHKVRIPRLSERYVEPQAITLVNQLPL